MARHTVFAAFSALLALAAAPAPAAEPDPVRDGFDKRQFTCPIGGGRFTQDVGYSTFPLVTFPDGSYPGDEKVDAEIPVCPGNGLIILPDFDKMAAGGAQSMIYADYSPAELALLPALIADPAYAALKADGLHAQGYWLATRLGRPATLRFVLLQRATWAATDPALRRRLVERLVAEGPALIDAAEQPDQGKRRVRYYIVNALRELGRFDEALALIDAIEGQGPPVAAPVDPDSMYGPGAYAPQMRAVIAEKDMDRFPVALMPPKWANSICGGEEHPPPYGPLSATTKAACARRQAEMERRYAEDEASLQEMSALMEDPAALDRSCAATPAAKRSGGLARACEMVQRDRDTVAGEALAKDGPSLAAACEATPQDKQEGPLLHACISWESALESALGTALAEDEAGYATLCPNDGAMAFPDRVSAVSLACADAARQRYDRKIDRMLDDPAALDARCVGIDMNEPSDLSIACSQRASQLEQAERERIAGDGAAFKRKCGRFRSQLEELADLVVDDDDEELRSCRVIQSIRDSNETRDSLDASLADSVYADTSSLMTEARARAAAMIAQAKAVGTYPKRRPGDRD